MKKSTKILIVLSLVAVVGAVLAIKNGKGAASRPPPKSPELSKPVSKPLNEAQPRLVDLGAGKCIPCKMMAPILEDFKKNYSEKLAVEFIDVWENPDAAKKYNISIIPTQIFFAPDGRELFRHEGFFSKEEILGKWKELGVDLSKPVQ